MAVSLLKSVLLQGNSHALANESVEMATQKLSFRILMT